MNVLEPYWRQVNIGSGNGLVPPGTKPLPEPMLTRIMSPYGITKQQWVNPFEEIWKIYIHILDNIFMQVIIVNQEWQ